MSEQPTAPDNTALQTMPDNTGMTTKQKAFFILLGSSSISAMAACCYLANKRALNYILHIFDDIIDTIETPTKTRTKTE